MLFVQNIANCHFSPSVTSITSHESRNYGDCTDTQSGPKKNTIWTQVGLTAFTQTKQIGPLNLRSETDRRNDKSIFLGAFTFGNLRKKNGPDGFTADVHKIDIPPHEIFNDLSRKRQ